MWLPAPLFNESPQHGQKRYDYLGSVGDVHPKKKLDHTLARKNDVPMPNRKMHLTIYHLLKNPTTKRLSGKTSKNHNLLKVFLVGGSNPFEKY